jgi:hypothetical protein
VNGLALERHGRSEGGAGLRRQLFLETSLEREVAGVTNQLAHSSDLAITPIRATATSMAA